MDLHVYPNKPKTTTGFLRISDHNIPCALGRSGTIPQEQKREGDGATPEGVFPLRRLWYRQDKVSIPIECTLPTKPITPTDGWCDDEKSPSYNKPILLSLNLGIDRTLESHERLWRSEDDLYDFIVEIGYNDEPSIPGHGSAIFLHVARTKMTPTAGCIAVSKQDMIKILPFLSLKTRIHIHAAAVA